MDGESRHPAVGFVHFLNQKNNITTMAKEKKNSWSWKISDEELKNQVENYSELKITKSYRGISVLIICSLLVFSLLLGFFDIGVTTSDVLYSLVVYIPILFFVDRGHRWAIIAIMILWTLENGYRLMTGGVIGALIWWFGVMPYFWKALKVENERKKKNKSIPSLSTSKRFCTSCGQSIEADSKFCISCGNKVLSPNT